MVLGESASRVMDHNDLKVADGNDFESEIAVGENVAPTVLPLEEQIENCGYHTSSNDENDYSDFEEECEEAEKSNGKEAESLQFEAGKLNRQTSKTANKPPRGKKRRKPANTRKNIRKVLKTHQLDPKTLEAQQEEQERLQRLELLRTQSEQASTAAPTPPDSDNVPPSAPVANPILILDDGDGNGCVCGDNKSDGSDDSSSDEDDSTVPNIILISSSDSEEEQKSNNDKETDSDNSEDCANMISTANLKWDSGDVLVNVGHFPDEPEIFLPPQVGRVIKPHQIVGVRFLYENLIESTKNFTTTNGLGCILAHAMGLGKTIQTVSLIHIFLHFTPSKKVLVLVPINTLQNWLNEFDMWVPKGPKEESGNADSRCEGVSGQEEMDKVEDCETHEFIIPGAAALDSSAHAGTNDSEQASGDAVKQENDLPASMEEASCSSASKNCTSEKLNFEYRNYEVFIINDSQKTTNARASIVDQWHTKGGVLIMGYEMYRMIALYKASLCNSVTNSKGKKKKKARSFASVIDIDEEEKEMKRMLEMQRAMCDPGPDLVVCDEGHRIKNHQSNIHNALHKIRTRRRLVLTGYPLQNNLTEYWCMVDFVRPNYLGTRQEFQNMFERPIVNGQCMDSTGEDKKLMKYRAHVLSSLLKGFVQRKDYTSLKVALPPKEEHVVMVRMSEIQEAVYRRFILLMQEGYGEQLNPIKIFAICSKIWNHPDILYKAMVADQSKKSVFFERDVDMVTEDGMKMKNFMKTSQKLARGSPSLTNEVGFNPFANDAKTLLSKISDWAKEVFDSHKYEEGRIESSGKFVILMELIKESMLKGDKMLIFSQSLLTLDLIEEILNRTKIYQEGMDIDGNEGEFWRKNSHYFRIDGSTGSSERERLIELFNRKDNHAAKLFLLSTRAGCLGINLIGANRVVVLDVSWNPCHDAQAVCRVYRYGQQKPCYIYRLIASNTMEKRMYYRQISKQGVSDRVIDEMNPVENFSKDELNKLLSTSWDEEPESNFSNDCGQINDPLLKNICQQFSHWIINLPFQHESLLLDQKSSKLSNREKREAKRGYEEEKRRAVYSVNGPFSQRVPPFLPMPNMALAESTRQLHDQFLQNQLLSSPQIGAFRAPGSAGLSNLFRQAEQLRNESSSDARSNLLDVFANQAKLQNVFYRFNMLNQMSPVPSNYGQTFQSSSPTASSKDDPNATPSAGTPSVSNLTPQATGQISTHSADSRIYSTDILSQPLDGGASNSQQANFVGRHTPNDDKSQLMGSGDVICIDSDGDSD